MKDSYDASQYMPVSGAGCNLCYFLLQVGWSVEGLQRMERQGRQHLPTNFTMLLQSYTNAGPESFQKVCDN